MEGLAEMKTAEELVQEWYDSKCTVRSIIEKAQSDAFHAGKLEGLSQAREICRQKFDSYDEESTLGAIVALHESAKNK
jgi:hypothetical protein